MPTVRYVKPYQVTLPKEFWETLGIEAGDIAIAEVQDGKIVISPLKLSREDAIRGLHSLLNEVHAQNPGVTEEEVVEAAMKTIREVREEEYAKQRQA